VNSGITTKHGRHARFRGGDGASRPHFKKFLCGNAGVRTNLPDCGAQRLEMGAQESECAYNQSVLNAAYNPDITTGEYDDGNFA